jgi:hypothetical protein
MIAYNITIKLLPQIEKEWVAWQRNEHIPEMLASGCFTDYKLYRLLEQDESDGLTYIIQLFSSSLSQYQAYIDNYAGALRQKALDKWGNRFIAFRTVMQVVSE